MYVSSVEQPVLKTVLSKMQQDVVAGHLGIKCSNAFYIESGLVVEKRCSCGVAAFCRLSACVFAGKRPIHKSPFAERILRHKAAFVKRTLSLGLIDDKS